MNSPQRIEKRKEHEQPLVTEGWGWKFHHIGIPTKEKGENERYLPHFKMYVSGFETSPYGIEWMRFEEDCPISDFLKNLPHVAFEVNNLKEAIKGKELIGEPNCPAEGIKVAMILHNGAPVELIEFDIKDNNK